MNETSHAPEAAEAWISPVARYGTHSTGTPSFCASAVPEHDGDAAIARAVLDRVERRRRRADRDGDAQLAVRRELPLGGRVVGPRRRGEQDRHQGNKSHSGFHASPPGAG